MNEQWKDIQGFEGLYQVSNTGQIMSLLRLCKRGEVYQGIRRRVLRQFVAPHGYLTAVLSKQGVKKTYKVHRLVALHFVEGFTENRQVNHKDEDKLNNKASNLEWVTAKENMNYGTCIARKVAKTSKPINQLSKSGEFIKIWEIGHDAERVMRFNNGNVNQVCQGKRKTAYGFRWEFAE